MTGGATVVATRETWQQKTTEMVGSSLLVCVQQKYVYDLPESTMFAGAQRKKHRF